MTTSSPSKPLAGRIALVTGATRGIGAAIALHMAQAGYVVIGVDHPGRAFIALANLFRQSSKIRRNIADKPMIGLMRCFK